jgi:hypothetical protein
MPSGRIPVFLGSDPFGGPDAVAIGFADFDGEGDISITVKTDRLKVGFDKLVEMAQIRGLALNVAIMAPAVKKENENGRT